MRGKNWITVLLLLLQSRESFPFVYPRKTQATTFNVPRIITGGPLRTTNLDLSEVGAFEKQVRATEFGIGEELDSQKVKESGRIRIYKVGKDLQGKRVDAALAALEPSLSRSSCGNLIADGVVRVIDQRGKSVVIDRKSFKVASGTIMRIELPKKKKPTEIKPENIPLDVLYEDEHMIVLNKAADMVVHPAAGHWSGTVVNALAHYLSTSSYGSGEFVNKDGSLKSDSAEGIHVDGTDGEAISFRPGIVHRLDKGTSGVLVVAKTRDALAALSAAFKERKVKKTYLAVTVGNPGKRVVIDKPIGRHPIHRQRMRVVPDPHKKDSRGHAPKDRLVDNRPPSQAGRRAISFIDTLFFDGKLSLVQVRIETGRTHQIRVHLQDRHTPVYGDTVYGLQDWNKKLEKTHQIDRPLLHAYSLHFDHPITGEPMKFRAPLAKDMIRIAKAVWPQGDKLHPDLFSEDPSS